MIRRDMSRAHLARSLRLTMLLGILFLHSTQRVVAEGRAGATTLDLAAHRAAEALALAGPTVRVTIQQPRANDGRHLQVSVHTIADAAPATRSAPPAGAHANDVVVAVLRTAADAAPGLARVAPTTRIALGAGRDSLPLRFLLPDPNWGGATDGWRIPFARLPLEPGGEVGVWRVVALVDAPQPSTSPVVVIDDVAPGAAYLYTYLVLAPRARTVGAAALSSDSHASSASEPAGRATAAASDVLATVAAPSAWQLIVPQAQVVGLYRGRPAWFNVRKLGLLGVILLTGGGLFGFARLARRRPLFVRRIAGVDAIEDSIGRATEMGKPVLYVTGVEEAQDIQTIAGLLILSHVAKLTAEYEADIRVANAHPLTMVVAEEMVRKGYADAGRLDAHKPDNVMFITSEQFAFAAGVNGIILRERPATNIYFGRFYAESLMLAETGYLTGAVQIAGTAELTQMPFFVAACDYTLIGEELFATSAYLTREPTQLAQLKAGDLLKVVLGVITIAGALLATLHALGVLPSTALAVLEAVFP